MVSSAFSFDGGVQLFAYIEYIDKEGGPYTGFICLRHNKYGSIPVYGKDIVMRELGISDISSGNVSGFI